MTTNKEEGKRFSKRTVEEHKTEDGLVYLERIQWDDHLTDSTIERYRLQAIAVLKAADIDVDTLLEEAPHGTRVRDYVLNYKSMEPDSQPSLAARILEVALHLKAYAALPGGEKQSTALAYYLGRLTMLFDAYAISGEMSRTSARKKRPRPRDPLRGDIKRAFASCRSHDMSLKQALISLCNNGFDDIEFEDSGGTYLVSSPQIEARPYSLDVLEKIFTDAGK